ncbi:gtpase effector dia diaphanous [Moniliophthora roreri]|nr:gtpase effector dia diaphanous [Moniliophthora roreri]
MDSSRNGTEHVGRTGDDAVVFRRSRAFSNQKQVIIIRDDKIQRAKLPSPHNTAVGSLPPPPPYTTKRGCERPDNEGGQETPPWQPPNDLYPDAFVSMLFPWTFVGVTAKSQSGGSCFFVRHLARRNTGTIDYGNDFRVSLSDSDAENKRRVSDSGPKALDTERATILHNDTRTSVTFWSQYDMKHNSYLHHRRRNDCFTSSSTPFLVHMQSDYRTLARRSLFDELGEEGSWYTKIDYETKVV